MTAAVLLSRGVRSRSQRDLLLPRPASRGLAGLGEAEADPGPPFSVRFCVEYPAFATVSLVVGPGEGRE